ncbi:MAG: pilin [Pseudoxanthomonas sp.]
MSAPPPLPSSRPTASTTPAQRPPNLSGGKIALIVAAACVVPLIGALGILAAIAVPAYHDYTLRSKVMEAMAVAAPLKSGISEFHAWNERCPGNGDEGFENVESLAGGRIASITVAEFDDGSCGIELYMQGTGSEHIDGKALWFEFDAKGGNWTCSSEIEDKYLPQSCRG